MFKAFIQKSDVYLCQREISDPRAFFKINLSLKKAGSYSPTVYCKNPNNIFNSMGDINI